MSIRTVRCEETAASIDSGTPPSSWHPAIDRKSTRLNSSHSQISYAVFCLKKKKHKHVARLIRLNVPSSSAVARTTASHVLPTPGLFVTRFDVVPIRLRHLASVHSSEHRQA